MNTDLPEARVAGSEKTKISVSSQKAQQCTETARCRVLRMLMLAWVQERSKFVDEKHDDYGRHRNLLNCRLIKAGRAFGESTAFPIQLFLLHSSLSIRFWPLSDTGCWAKQASGLTQSGCS